MRIIGGEFKRKRLYGPSEKMPTRPIPDLVKEALFNLLRGHVEGQECYDGFAGSGAIGLEAISRGAKRCVFIERDKNVMQVLQKNIDHVGAGERAAPWRRCSRRARPVSVSNSGSNGFKRTALKPGIIHWRGETSPVNGGRLSPAPAVGDCCE